MKKLEGITISTIDRKRGIAVDTKFTNLEAIILAALIGLGTYAVANGVSKFGAAFIEQIKNEPDRKDRES